MKPSTRHVLILTGPDTLSAVSLNIPKLRPDQVLLKTACVAVNPSDAKLISAGFPHGVPAGLDFSGTVVATGSDDTAQKFPVGSRICGMALGYHHSRSDENDDGDDSGGAFAD